MKADFIHRALSRPTHVTPLAGKVSTIVLDFPP